MVGVKLYLWRVQHIQNAFSNGRLSWDTYALQNADSFLKPFYFYFLISTVAPFTFNST